MDTFSQIIDAYGIRELAALLGITESHVRVMKTRDSIPFEYWPVIVASPPDSLRAVLTFDSLMALRGTKKPSRKETAA